MRSTSRRWKDVLALYERPYDAKAPVVCLDAAGQTTATAVVTGLSAGTTVITATAAGYATGYGTVTVVDPALTFHTLSGVHVLTPTTAETVLVGDTRTLVLRRPPSQAAAGLAVTLESSDAALFTITPALVTFAPDEYEQTVTIAGLAPGAGEVPTRATCGC